MNSISRSSYQVSEQDMTKIFHRLQEIEHAISTFQVRINLGVDFSIFKDLANAIPEKKFITAVYDNTKCQIDGSNGFWISGHDNHGELIHIQAMRFDDLNQMTLSEQWLREPEMFAPTGHKIKLDKCDFVTAPASHEITGRVCYHGDFWLDPEFRKLDLAPLLSRYSSLQALYKFAPDYIYGLIPPALVERGWAARQGYLHMHPWAPRWRIHGEARYYDDYLVWIKGDELLRLWTADHRNIDILSRMNIAYNGAKTAARYVQS